MKKALRILIIIGVFILFTFLVTFVWYTIESRILSSSHESMKFSDFWLYILGYGDIQNVQYIFKMSYSMLGILSLALLSSVFTVSLFEFRKKLEISKMILVWNRDDPTGSVALMNNSSDVYNVNLKLHLDMGDNRQTVTKHFPYISKNTSLLVDFPIQPGTILYKYIRHRLIHKNAISSAATLAIITDYIDSKDGQEHYACNKYFMDLVHAKRTNISVDYSIKRIDKNLIFRASKYITHKYDDEFEAELTRNCFRFDMDLFEVCNSKEEKEYIELHKGVAPATKRDILDIYIEQRKPNPNIDVNKLLLSSGVHFDKNAENKDFGMIVMRKPMSGDWTKYYDMNCILSFGYYVSSGITLTVQVKRREPYKHIIDTRINGSGQFLYNLRDHHTREEFAVVDELCFCVVHKDMKTKKGDFSIIGCEFLVPQEEYDS